MWLILWPCAHASKGLGYLVYICVATTEGCVLFRCNYTCTGRLGPCQASHLVSEVSCKLLLWILTYQYQSLRAGVRARSHLSTVCMGMAYHLFMPRAAAGTHCAAAAACILHGPRGLQDGVWACLLMAGEWMRMRKLWGVGACREQRCLCAARDQMHLSPAPHHLCSCTLLAGAAPRI